MQLHGVVALVESTRAGLGDLGGNAVAQQARIGRERAERSAAEQPPKRQVRRFARDIPERDVQGRQRIDVWTVATEQMQALGEARHQAANVARVLAERGRSELRIDDRARRRAAGVTEAFAPAVEALVRDDAHQQRVEARPADAEKGGRSRADVAGRADQMGLDRHDLHGGLNDVGPAGTS